MLLRSRPLVPAAVLFILGIGGGRALEVPIAASLGALGLGMILALIPRSRMAGTALALISLGAVLYSARYRITTENDARLVLLDAPELMEVRGRIEETPALRDYQSGTNDVIYSHATLRLSEFLRDGEWRPVSGSIVTRTRGELSAEFWEGREVQILGVMEPPPQAAAEGLFDYRAHLKNLRIYHQLKSDSTNDWQLLSFEAMPVTERFRRWAKVQLQRGLPENDENVQMIWAMTLGIKRALSGEASESFMKTGTMHIFAVSGLHVACIAGFLLFLLQAAGLPRAWSGSITIPIIWFYTLATGWQSSAIRSALMFSVIIGGRMIRRPSDLLNSTAAAAIIVLLFQPEQLFQAGFQLSFVVVASIGLFVPILEQFWQSLLKADPLLPESLTPHWQRWLGSAWRVVGTMLAVSGASWLGATAIVAYYFNIVTLNSFVANLVAVPLSSVSLGATVLSLAIPPLNPISNFIAWVFMGYTIRFTEMLATLPYGFLYVPKPNAAFLVFYYGLVLSLAIVRTQPAKQKILTGLAVGMMGLFWAFSVLAGRPTAAITILPCGGTPAYIETREDGDLLIDASSERDADYTVKRFLRARGRASMDRLLLTHGDAQNAGGFGLIWTEFNPGKVITSVARARSTVYRRALQVLENHPGRWMEVSAGTKVGRWEVLHPDQGRGFPRADDNCVVLKGTFNGWTILHLAELGPDGLRQLIERGGNLRADIVIAGMPERDEPLQAELLEAIQPKAIILGTTRYPHTAVGSPELRERLISSGATVFYTDDRAVTLVIRRGECKIRRMNDAEVIFTR